MKDRNLMIGIDLNIRHPQICYYETNTCQSGVVPMKVGNADVNLQELLDDPAKTADPETVRTMAELFREVFHTVGIEAIAREIAGLMFTARKIDRRLVGLLRGTADLLGIPANRVLLQDYNESLFYYIAYQSQELWNRNAVMFEFEESRVRCFRMSQNPMTRPVTVRILQEEEMEIESYEKADREEQFRNSIDEKRDEQFSRMIRRCLKNELFSSIFITGRGFDTSWAKRSVGELKRHARKVYTEDNLFAKGACNAARERMDEKRIQGILYMGDTLVQYNIGMDMQIGDRVGYYPLITAGRHWYNASCDCEFLLGDSDTLTFIVSSMENGGRFRAGFRLDGIPERPPRTTRIHLHMEFEAADLCRIRAEDLGFGEIFPSSGKIWQEKLEGIQ